jgi:hypothetical protein
VQAENYATLLHQNELHKLLTVEVVEKIEPGEELYLDYGPLFWKEDALLTGKARPFMMVTPAAVEESFYSDSEDDALSVTKSQSRKALTPPEVIPSSSSSSSSSSLAVLALAAPTPDDTMPAPSSPSAAPAGPPPAGTMCAACPPPGTMRAPVDSIMERAFADMHAYEEREREKRANAPKKRPSRYSSSVVPAENVVNTGTAESDDSGSDEGALTHTKRTLTAAQHTTPYNTIETDGVDSSSESAGSTYEESPKEVDKRKKKKPKTSG